MCIEFHSLWPWNSMRGCWFTMVGVRLHLLIRVGVWQSTGGRVEKLCTIQRVLWSEDYQQFEVRNHGHFIVGWVSVCGIVMTRGESSRHLVAIKLCLSDGCGSNKPTLQHSQAVIVWELKGIPVHAWAICDALLHAQVFLLSIHRQQAGGTVGI